VDLHLIPNANPSPSERAALDGLLGPLEPLDSRVVRQATPRRDLLLPALHALQGRAGFISPGGLNYLCERLTVPPAEAFAVASFYALISTEPRPAAVARVCDDLACRVSGALELCREMEERLGPPEAPAMDGKATWTRSPCLGLCECAPAVFLQLAGEGCSDRALAPASPDAISLSLEGAGQPPTIHPALSLSLEGEGKGEGRVPGMHQRRGSRAAPQTLTPEPGQLKLLRRVGAVDPTSLDDYRAHGGYAALRHALRMTPDAVIRHVAESGLAGRGGAAFPTGRKWEAVARAPVHPHYLVCNADESEPGTFKDRVLMEEDPFALVEAMSIAAYATGCERGYVYVRGEYPLALARLQNAVNASRSRGLLGDDVMGKGLHFDIELRRGAGAYICGEETALFNSIQGLRGEPRNKPPFPTEAGLFGKPTLVNNVETLFNVLDIILSASVAQPPSAVRELAQMDPNRTAAIPPLPWAETKLFAVSGCVMRPGVYEVPIGTTLRQLLDLAGGVRSGRSLRAVLLGGAAGTFITPNEVDVPLTVEGTRSIAATLGSGAVLVFDDSVGLTDILARIAALFRDESCGQCVPCRVGTQRLEEAVHRLAAGTPLVSHANEIALIDDIAQAMQDASICGLGQTAPSALQSAITKLGIFSGTR